jgi:hypothetical protein
LAVDLVHQNASLRANADSCAEGLRKIDETIAKDSIAGERTCALAIITSEEILGASVRDSGVWLILGKRKFSQPHPKPATEAVPWFDLELEVALNLLVEFPVLVLLIEQAAKS